MKNGDYILVVAPQNYPGNKYRGRYCYEHHLVLWTKLGILPNDTESVHHINGNKKDNRIDNLVIMDKRKHCGFEKSKPLKELTCMHCGKKFYRKKIHLETKNHFCSRRCIGLKFGRGR